MEKFKRMSPGLILVIAIAFLLVIYSCLVAFGAKTGTGAVEGTTIPTAYIAMSPTEYNNQETSADTASNYTVKELDGYDFTESTTHYVLAYTNFNTGDEVLAALTDKNAKIAFLPMETAQLFFNAHQGYTIVRDSDILTYSNMLRSDESDLRNQIDAALGEMKSDGALDALQEKYMKDNSQDAVVMPTAEGGRTVKVSFTNFAAPFEFENAQGQMTGLAPAIYAELGKRLGINFELVSVSHADIDAALQDGRVDVATSIVGVSEKLSDTDDTLFTQPYYESAIAFLMQTSSFDNDLWEEYYGKGWGNFMVSES